MSCDLTIIILRLLKLTKIQMTLFSVSLLYNDHQASPNLLVSKVTASGLIALLCVAENAIFPGRKKMKNYFQMNDATHGCILELMKISPLPVLCTLTPRDLLEYDDDRIRFFYAFYTLSWF